MICEECNATGITNSRVCYHCEGTGQEPSDIGYWNDIEEVWVPHWILNGTLTPQAQKICEENYQNESVYWPVLYRNGKPVRHLAEVPCEYGRYIAHECEMTLLYQTASNERIRWIERRRRDRRPQVCEQYITAS